MQVDFLIVGQGICGTMLSWFLHKQGKSFLVVDDGNEDTSSKIAAGIINPVTGRRYAYSWMFDEVMPFALAAYEEIGIYLDEKYIVEKSIIDFFPSPQMRNAFVERLTENGAYLHSFPDQNKFNRHFNYDFGCGEIRPAFLVNLQSLLSSWRAKLKSKDLLWEDQLQTDALTVSETEVSYQDVRAQRIIFCDGSSGAGAAWFDLLPFAPNKGEALIVECNDLTNEHIFKKGLMLAPLSEPGLYWVGSNYQWEFQDKQPSRKFYEQTINILNGWLKRSYKVLAHKAAIRPATLERRPFVGFHPQYPCIGILNGMGTKGSSLGPFFANQLVQHLIHNLPITPEADVKRFSRILSRN